MKNDTKKRVLLIAPLFFDYYKEMIKELRNMEYEVDYICDAPSNSNISKALGRINKNLIKGSTKKYFENSVLPVIQNVKYDFVLLVGWMTFAFTTDMICQIKSMNSDARFVLYQWDSEKNLPYSTKIHKFFDEIYSFDRFDCEESEVYKFLPLFYSRTYEEIGKKNQELQKYDCCYVGTAHPKKYVEINSISKAVENVLPKQFLYHYMPSVLKFLYHKALSSEFRNVKMSVFNKKKLSALEIAKTVAESKCVLDAPQAGQVGLTMRTFECLGAKKKLITTNEDIKYYDFYREENILVFNGSVDESDKFFAENYVELPEEIYQKYSLRNWLKTMLGE